MPRSPNVFRQSDVTRVLRGVAEAGVNVARIEIVKGERIIVYLTSAAAGGSLDQDDLDRELSEFKARNGQG
jgi:hypothetical protein